MGYGYFDEGLTGLEHLLLAGRRLGMAPGEAQARAAGLLVGLDLAKVANQPVRTFAPGARRRLDLAFDLLILGLMGTEPGRSNGGTGRARMGWGQAVPSTDSPGSARSL